ncbi:hypothetical protein Mal64_34920 [Pseudobythopirellula maris]|uniref:PEP-CTERM protein-sorting domain-containing protein n=1 Tax=Pseudobythopirellula maris TaxID=2527991 RepID=A0A5C5ZJP6_9BACT|nr:PEP-CTERM sorting domain-containing protein [Pseudobythopirellula maris]TWT86663.1 hypothetical protein Mal64_34920 [Pseudobythopirellula maris]
MSKSTLAVLVLALACGADARGATMFFDFGNGSIEAGGVYNQVYSAVTHTVPNAQDSTGSPTGVQLVTSGFHEFGGNESGTGSPAAPADMFVANATRDSLYGHSTSWGSAGPRETGLLTLSGLDGSGDTTYEFDFFAARSGVGDNRDALYAVAGLNSGSGVLDAANNTANLATVAGITPTAAGEITITVTKGPGNNNGNGFFYLGAMRLVGTTVPEPSAVVLLTLAGVACVIRRR